MSEYLLKAKSIADQLAIASKPLDDDDFILYILGGLGPNYGPFVTSIIARDAHIRLSDLHGLLLSEEIRVNDSHTDNQPISINAATKTSPSPTRGRGDSVDGGVAVAIITAVDGDNPPTPTELGLPMTTLATLTIVLCAKCATTLVVLLSNAISGSTMHLFLMVQLQMPNMLPRPIPQTFGTRTLTPPTTSLLI